MTTPKSNRFVFRPTKLLADRLDAEADLTALSVHRLETEDDKIALALSNRLILKINHRLHEGVEPEIETSLFLSSTALFTNMPALLGTIEYVDKEGNRTALAILQSFIRSQGDAWRWTLHALKRVLETQALAPTSTQSETAPPDSFATYVPHMRRLGQRTAELHKALAVETDDQAFAAEPLTFKDVEAAAARARSLAERAFTHLERLKRQASVTEETSNACMALLHRQQDCFALIERLTQPPVGAIKIRIHGDYHLGQLLVVKDDVVILNFEANSARTIAERRTKASPLLDVADMVRSFAYAVETARRDLARQLPGTTVASELAKERLRFSRVFIDAYMEAATDSAIWIKDQPTRIRLLRLFFLSKALSALDHEALNRPDWIALPIEGVLLLLDETSELA